MGADNMSCTSESCTQHFQINIAHGCWGSGLQMMPQASMVQHGCNSFGSRNAPAVQLRDGGRPEQAFSHGRKGRPGDRGPMASLCKQ
eukprot:3488592-Lingulodinium_polyedra.AAC.1